MSTTLQTKKAGKIVSRNINFLRYDAETGCHAFVERMEHEGHNPLIACTTRTDAEQLDVYNAGNSNAKTPSFHAEHAGLAFDVCKNVKGHEYDDPAFFEAVGRIGKAMGFTWGGDWTSIIDKPHLQWDNHGQYTSAMIRTHNYPPPMPLFTGVIPPPENKPMPLLEKGSNGTDVVTLQNRLNYLGYPCGKPDGDFGPRTEWGVHAFQKAAKILVDGRVGPQTWGALDEAKPTGLLLEIKKIKRIEYVKGTEPVEKIDSAYNRIGCTIITNANFFGISSGNPTGYIMDEGAVASAWLLSKSGFEFRDKKTPVFTHWDNRTGADFLGGYPLLIKDGKVSIDTKEDAFSSNNPAYRRGRTAIGIKADGTFIIRAVSDADKNRLTIPELAECMLAIGCVNAVNLDGGGSTSWIAPDNKYITSRALDGFLAVWR